MGRSLVRTAKRSKRAKLSRLIWKIRKGLVKPPNDKKNTGPIVEKQDLKYSCLIKTEVTDIKQENFDYDELHHEIDIKEEFHRNCTAFHSSEYKTDNENYLHDHSQVHESEKQFICKICEYRAANRSSLVLHNKIHRVKKCFRCYDCDFITDSKTDLIGHLNV